MIATPMLRVKDVAERLACTQEIVLAHIHSGQLPATNIGNRVGRPTWRIDPVDLDAFVSGRTARPPEPRPVRRKRRHDEPIKDFFPEFSE